MKRKKNLKILLVCDNDSDIINIKARVETYDGVSCYVWQCPTLSEGIHYLDIKRLRADIIILDLGLKDTEDPKEVYNKMEIAAHDIPVIVITGKGSEQHRLATFVIESGAADNIIRGEFSGLADSIEFALIRSKIMKDQKSRASKKLQDTIKADKEENLQNKLNNQNNLSVLLGGYSASDYSPED